MRTIFIGDIHGCAAELEELLDKLRFRKGADRLLLTGDAFTKGPEPLGVWRGIARTGAEMVMGNHDARLKELLEARRKGETGTTLDPSHAETLEKLQPAAEELLLWLTFLPYCIRDGDFILVHAGINPDKGLSRTSRDELLAIRTWPPAEGLEGPRWHDHVEPDGATLVFGHDAPGGLVLKRPAPGARPYVVGLDTGCVYGGQLTAWILEDDEIVQVESHQPGR